MKGEYKGSPIELSRTQTGQGTLKEVGATNQKFLKQDIANAFKERYPGNEILLDDSAEEDEAPPAPFTRSEYSHKGPWGKTEPRWASVVDARLELAAKFGNSSWKDYTKEFTDKDERLEHWSNAKELWTSNPGVYTDSLNTGQTVSTTTPQPIQDVY